MVVRFLQTVDSGLEYAPFRAGQLVRVDVLPPIIAKAVQQGWAELVRDDGTEIPLTPVPERAVLRRPSKRKPPYESH